jgi:hypothetical protein
MVSNKPTKLNTVPLYLLKMFEKTSMKMIWVNPAFKKLDKIEFSIVNHTSLNNLKNLFTN